MEWVALEGDPLGGAITSLPAGAEADLHGERGWQVVGPHGAGKSALLYTLADSLRSRGGAVELLDADAALERDYWFPDVVHFVEGFERLARAERRRCFDRWRRHRASYVITPHRRLRRWRGAPRVLAELRPDRRLLSALFDRLTEARATPVTLDDAIASFERRRGNLRDVWFDLYNLHERHRA